MDIEDVISYVKSSRPTEIDPATKKEIADAVQFIGHRMPRAWLTWMAEVGEVQIGAYSSLSIRKKHDDAQDRDRSYAWHDMEMFGTVRRRGKKRRVAYMHGVVPFVKRDDDFTYCLWVAKQKQGDCPIVLWNTVKRKHDDDGSEQYTELRAHHRSFVAWLGEQLGVPSPASGAKKRRASLAVNELTSRSSMDRVLADLAKRRSPLVDVGVEEQEIAQAEQELRVKLPMNYRRFLAQCGSASIGGTDVLGLGTLAKRDKERHVVRTTLSERRDGMCPLRDDLIAISPEGNGDFICLQPSKGDGEDCPVVSWSHEGDGGDDPAKQKPLRIAASFRRWLIDMLSAAPNQ
jgi:hypothetical protein